MNAKPYYQKIINLMLTPEFMTTIMELKQRKRAWLESTFSASCLKTVLGFKLAEIKKLKSDVQYGQCRYDKHYIAYYLKFRNTTEL